LKKKCFHIRDLHPIFGIEKLGNEVESIGCGVTPAKIPDKKGCLGEN
jgi:hypothetical protein